VFPDLVHLEHVAHDLWRPGPFGGATVMVGAGFSRNAAPGPATVGGVGMPNWSELTNALYNDLHPLQPELDERGKEERRRTAEKRTGSVSAAMRLADEYEALRGRTALDRLMLRAIPDMAYEPGPAHRLLCALPWADILTTNFDTLIERTLPGVLERRYNVVQAPEDLPGAIRPRVVKLHGGFPSSRPFVITEEDFRVYEKRAAAFVNLARQAFVETTVCLLGFSGDDPNFLRWSGWTRDVLGSARVNPIYLCGVLDLAPSQRALLQNRHVLPIDVSPLFPSDEWPDRDRRMAAATEWLLLALEAGRPIDLSNWPAGTVHPPTPPSRPGLPERPQFSFVGGLATEYLLPGFRPSGEVEPPAEPWSVDMSEQEQIARAQRIAEQHRQQTTGAQLRRQIEVLIGAWATNRASDPGWVVLPHRNRGELWTMTQRWVEPVISTWADVSPAVGLGWLEELTWRLDRCLLPMGDDVGAACARALTALGTDGNGGSADPVRKLESPVRARWFGVAGRLLRHYREACADAAFDGLADRLLQLADLAPDLANRVPYERALGLLERSRPLDAEEVVRGWTPADDSVWFGRRTGLLAEIGHPDAPAAAADVLRRVRSGLAASRDPNRRVHWLSREAMALMLVWSIGDHWTSQDLGASARFVDIGQAGCDPRADLDMLSDALARPPSATGDLGDERSFFDDVPMRLRARQLRRAYEDLGQPIAMIGVTTAAATGLRRSIPWLAEDDTDGALRAYTRLRKNLKSAHFAGVWLARASRTVVDGLADATSVFLERMVYAPSAAAESSPRIVRTGHRAPRPGEVRHEQARAALRLARTLLPRLDEKQVIRLVDACLGVRAAWRRDGEWQTWGELGQTARKSLESLPDERLGERLLAVVRQPIVGRDVTVIHGDSDEADPIFAFLVHAADGARRDASWDVAVLDLLDAAAPTLPRLVRTQALRRLWALYTREVLTHEERSRLRDAVWGAETDQQARQNEGMASDGADAATLSRVALTYPLPLWTLIFLPEPAGGGVHRMVRTWLSLIPLPSFRGEGTNTWTSKPTKYHDSLSQILMATTRPWHVADHHFSPTDWSPEEIERVLGHVERWWAAEGPAFVLSLRSAPASPFPRPWWRLTTIVDFIAYVALPACASRPDALQRCVRLAEKLQDAGIPVDLLVPLRLAAGTTTAADAGAMLREASSALDPERSPAFLGAVLLWMCLAEKGIVPTLPTDLVGEVAGGVRARRSPDLAWALQVAGTLVKRPGEPWTDAMLPDLLIGLQYLARETRPDARTATLALHPFDLMTIREEAASLLDTLAPRLQADDATARAWLGEADGEAFTSIKGKLLSARRRLKPVS